MNWEVLEQYSDYAVPGAIGLVVLLVLLLLIRMIGRKVSVRRGNRLGVAEFHEIDSSRRLVLVRRDDVEHLVMIGGNQDIVIESGIGGQRHGTYTPRSTMTPSLDIPPKAESLADLDEADRTPPPMSRPPQPAVFGDRAPNLRPVPPREEPLLDQPDKETKSS